LTGFQPQATPRTIGRHQTLDPPFGLIHRGTHRAL
jgi:hypothetical protein